MTRPIQRVNAPAFGTEVIVSSVVLVAGADWWDPATEGLCIVAAYRAINTPGNTWVNDQPANYAATLVNNANPGTFNLVEGNGAIPWNALTGWQGGGGGAAQYFLTGVIPATGWTVLAQFNSVVFSGASQCAAGEITAGAGLAVFPRTLIGGAGQHRYYDGASVNVAPGLANANMGATGNQGYLNGVADGAAIFGWTLPNANDIYLLAYNLGFPGGYLSGNLESAAIYNCILTPAQMLAVAIAMSQL